MDLNFNPEMFEPRGKAGIQKQKEKEELAGQNVNRDTDLQWQEKLQEDLFVKEEPILPIPISTISNPPFIDLMKNVNNRLKCLGPAGLFGIDPKKYETSATDIKVRSDGKVTDFYVDGKRYSIRYDENGNVTKTFVQEFDEDGKITGQSVTNYDSKNGREVNTVDYKYTYDADGNRTGEVRNAVSAKYGNPINMLQEYFGGVYLPDNIEDVKVDKDGKITDFYVDGVRYSFRYDSNGNIEKTIKQTFHENGNIKSQVINDKIGSYSEVTKLYLYDENGTQMGQPQIKRNPLGTRMLID